MKNLILLTAFSLAACGQEPITAAPTGADLSVNAGADLGVGSDGDVMVSSYLPPSMRPTNRAERRALSEASWNALKEVGKILRSSADWREADGRIQALIASETDPLRRLKIESVAATRMLRDGALDSPNSTEALGAVGRYTEMLVEGHSLEFPTVAASLVRLEGHWSPDRIASLASTAVVLGEMHLAKQASCDECSPEEVSEVIARVHGGTQAKYGAESVDAVVTLRRLASGS